MFWVGALLGAVLFVAMAQRPQMPTIQPATYEDFGVPTAELGGEHELGFGLNLYAAPNVTWYGDLDYREIKK